MASCLPQSPVSYPCAAIANLAGRNCFLPSEDVSGPGRCHTPNHGAVGSVAEVSAEDTEQLLKVLQVDLLTLICFFVVFVQLDNPDEQAAQIRRELDGRLQMAEQIAKVK